MLAGPIPVGGYSATGDSMYIYVHSAMGWGNKQTCTDERIHAMSSNNNTNA